MALQQSSYDNLPLELNLYILKFLDLEKLVDNVIYIDKKHRQLVIDILKHYTLTKNDCNNYWFEFIKHKNTQFLHKYLKPQDGNIMIRSSITHQNTIRWNTYLHSILICSIIKNNYYLYGCILFHNQTGCINIRQRNGPNNKWYLSAVTQNLIMHIIKAIEYNSLDIIRLIFSNKHIKFVFNKDDIEEKTFAHELFLNFANSAIKYNKVDVLKYFTLGISLNKRVCLEIRSPKRAYLKA